MHAATFDADPRSVAASRRFVGEAAADSLCDEEQMEVLRLLTSEVATNAVRHAGSRFTVEVTCLRDRIHIEVCDEASAAPAPVAEHDGQIGGWGLRLVDELSAAWGVAPRSPGKCVWFDLALHRHLNGR